MLVTKKSKYLDGVKMKNAQSNKKIKNKKSSPPSKMKFTPQKKIKKDENISINRLSYYNNTQTIELHKYKDKDAWKNTTKKLSDNHKKKLLTTSPVMFELSHSNSQIKSKSKSKSRSASRMNTQRSHNERDRDILIKNVTRKLYTHVKEQLKEKSFSKSKSKSKSKTRIKTDRDLSPLPQSKRKIFNVTDRQIILKKSENSQIKKMMKKKKKCTNNQLAYQFMATDRCQPDKKESKIKLKKQVPNIRTQFSERRGSFFDEILLDRLQLKLADQKCPFINIKSKFQFHHQTNNLETNSRSEMNTFEQLSSTTSTKNKQLEQFKIQQELKWNMMLQQLYDLKKQKKIPEKIDDIIKQLNENFNKLHQKASVLDKNKIEGDKKIQLSRIITTNREVVQKQFDSQIKKQQAIDNNCISLSMCQQSSQNQKNIAIVSEDHNKTVQQNKSIIPQLLYLKCVIYDREVQNQVSQQSKKDNLNQNNNSISNQVKNNTTSQVQNQTTQNQFKKSNNIYLNSDFFDCFQKNKLKLQIISHENTQQKKDLSPQIIKQIDSNQASDKDILQSLINLNDGASQFIEVISFSKNDKCEFQTQLQSLRQQQHEHFYLQDVKFNNEVHMKEQISSQSILLQSDYNIKMEQLITQIQSNLILDFCTTILKSKQILHNFLTTYSQLVDANIINSEYQHEENNNCIPSDNNHVLQLLRRLIDHIKVNYKNYFLEQIQLPFECKPIQILKFIRCTDDEPTELLINSEKNISQHLLAIPFFGLEKIQQFQRYILRNEYYIPNYFSFNHCVYDFFNDNIDQIRPYGSKGKPIFSLQLSHPITSYEEATEKIAKKCIECLSMNYYEQNLPDDKSPGQEGVFQLIYFTCLDVMEDFFEKQTLQMYQVMQRQLKDNQFRER